jgi:hypothetical protein
MMMTSQKMSAAISKVRLMAVLKTHPVCPQAQAKFGSDSI